MELLGEAEVAARACLAIREELRDQAGMAWLSIDASSLLGEVLFQRSLALLESDPATAAGALAEARQRLVEAGEAMWADTWKPGQRPPTAPEAAARLVELFDHLCEHEPDAGHESALPVWRERSSR